MNSKLSKLLKKIGRKWFLILVLIIIIVFIYNQIAALVITIITLILFILSYIPSFLFNSKMNKLLTKTTFIDDTTIAKRLQQPLLKIQNRMFSLSKKQAKKGWLILYINKQYVFYGEQAIDAFKTYHKKGLGEKDILEKLQKYGIKTRAEIKAIEEMLIKYDRLGDRDVSVKEYKEKQRFAK